MIDILKYYKSSIVQQRMSEYCGSKDVDPSKFTCEYLVGVKEKITNNEFYLSVENDKFFWLLEIGADIFRTVWDREATLFILDFEYYNIAYPAEAYFKPYDVFYKIEEIYQRVRDVYKKFNLNYISIQTGQGYHFVFKVPFGTPQHNKLVRLAYIEPTLQGKYNSISGRRKKKVSEETGKGFHMAGRLIEYICHKLLGNLKDYYGLPVVFSDVSIGKNKEAIALDLSMYADPIYMRDIRVPFSIYQKHRIYNKFKLSTRNIPHFAVLVRENNDTEYFKNNNDILDTRSQQDKVLEVATVTNCEIPNNLETLDDLLQNYQNSKLHEIHRQFDSCEHDPPEIWHKTYDRFNINILPPCVRHCLIEPNDHLLKPTNLQTLTRVLIKLGWHPKHIAGLIRSKYERNYGWGEIWYKYDAASRANFYVRIYSDLILTGIDKEEDLNCWSHFEKGYCWQPNCGFKLENYRLT